MPVQKFEPMTKNFAIFDCDAHVTEPPWLWERAKDWLTKDELEALKNTIWFDPESEQLIVNGKAGSGLGSQRIHGTPGTVNVLSLAGPGLKHDIQRALNVRNLKSDTALTAEQADYLDHKGSYEPKPRLRDMDVQGIDQVMIIPTDIDTYPWLQNAVGAKAMCKAYNDWAYEYGRRTRSACSSRRCYLCKIPNLPSKRFTASRPRVAASGWFAQSMPWVIIRFSPSTTVCGARWRRRAWYTGCIRFRPSDR
jgi:hypothetical protein